MRYEAIQTDRKLGITKGHIYEVETEPPFKGALSRLKANGQTTFLLNGREIINSGKVVEVKQ